MSLQQLTLNANNFSHNSTISSGDFSNLDVTSPGKIVFSNSDTDFAITHTFNSPQILNKLVINFVSSKMASDYLVQVSQDGQNYTTIATVSGMGSSADQEYSISQPSDVILYKSFRFSFTGFADSSVTEIEKINAFIPDNLDEYSYKDYNVEFDDALLDLEGWKNSRYNGSKLTALKINQFNQNDVSYGLNPVIENKTACIFIGNDVDEGDAGNRDNPLVGISNHSYLTINKILIVDLDNDDIEIISRENIPNVAFNRLVAENFPEGSSLVIKSLENSPNKLKPNHAVKFNQGQLMKIYSYTANQDGHEDGVFGGIGIREQKGQHIPNLGNNPGSSGGLFGFGMTAFVSASLFNTTSVQFTTFLPSELGDIEDNYNTDTMGSTLCTPTASFTGSFIVGQSSQTPPISTTIISFGE